MDSAELSVRIERLAPVRVAWVRAVGRTPEADAWRLLSDWARPAGLLADAGRHPVFGFNNPPPAAGSDEYGYELWVAVDADTPLPGGIGAKDFAGGLFAVAAATPGCGPDLPQRWKALLRWVHASAYTWRRTTHELERVRNPLAAADEIVLELYLPIEG